MALRSRLRPSSMNSRNGSQADGVGLGFSDPTPLKPTPNPVVTCMAGFESPQLLFLLGGRFSGLMLRFNAASSGSDPVATPLAAFAGTRPHAPGARTAMPAAFRYALPVSRRTPVACSIRRKDQPRRPKAITCCRFSSLKTLLMPAKGILPAPNQRPGINSRWPVLRWPSLAGFGWPLRAVSHHDVRACPDAAGSLSRG